MLIQCPECRQQISEQATSCPKCGRPVSHEDRERARAGAEKTRKATTGCGIGCLAFVLLIIIMAAIGGHHADEHTSLKGTGNTYPDTSNVGTRLVTKQSEVVVFCAYCGNKIRSMPGTVEVLESVTPQPRREYAICSRRQCQKAAKLRAKHPDWSTDTCYTIAQRKVQIGMTKDQVLAAWGKPQDINRTVTPFGTSEQWCYGDIGGTYLYFDDGVMTSFQD